MPPPRPSRSLTAGPRSSRAPPRAGIELARLRELSLLTAKPFVYVFNVDDAELADDALRDRLAKLVAPAESVFLDAKDEAELADLPPDEAAELLAELGWASRASTSWQGRGSRRSGSPRS
jgi:ribosome-binding ATPase YchF (GTP1/OBG family)